MEVNMFTATVMSAPVIYGAASQAPTQTALVIEDCEDTLNTLGNCNACNKFGHMKRDCPNQTKPGRTITENRRESLTAIIAINEGIWPKTVTCQRKIEVWGLR